MDTSELLATLLEDLTAELKDDVGFSQDILQIKIEQAIRKVITARRYPASYSDDMKLADLETFYSVIRDVALYDYRQIGVEFEAQHTENGTSRTYLRPATMLKVLPIAQF